MFYVMRLTDNFATRYGRMFPAKPGQDIPQSAINLARRCGGYIEKYGYGVVWTPKIGDGLH